MSQRTDIIPPGMENIFERFHYAPGVLIDDTLYIAGQVGRDENLEIVSGTEAQFVQAFENVGKVLSAAGAGFDAVGFGTIRSFGIAVTMGRRQAVSWRLLYVGERGRFMMAGFECPP